MELTEEWIDPYQKSNDPIVQYRELTKVIKKMDLDIKHLWDTVMIPYLVNIYDREQLMGMTEWDYSKFYAYMINNNQTCKYLYSELKILRERIIDRT